MALDPRYLDPSYWASLPIQSGTLPTLGGVAFGNVSAYPSEFDDAMLRNLINTFQGTPSNFAPGFTPFNADYISKNPWNQPAGGGDFFIDSPDMYNKPLSELNKYFSFNASDPVFGSLSAGVQDYLQRAEAYDPWKTIFTPEGTASANAAYGDWTPEKIQALFTPQDYATIEGAIQPYRTADQLYMLEMLRRAQSGEIKINSFEPGIFGAAMAALPAIVGATTGPFGGAIGGAISGNLSGGGIQGILSGALTGGIAGNGGLGNTLSGLGGTTGGIMNSITDALSGFTNASWNPFNIGNIQGALDLVLPDSLFNAFGPGLSEILSGAIPGALAGGALDGWQGAGIGGALGGLLGYGSNQFGTTGPLTITDWISNALFGGNNTGGGLSGGGTSGGTSGGGSFGGTAGNALGSLFGGSSLGGLAGLLGAGIPLAFLTNEANQASNTPTSTRTPFSSVNDGFATLDPAIRSALLESNQGYRDLLGQAQGNQNAFIQARVDPLIAQTAQQRGSLERSLGLRGVSGSSFGDQSLNRFDIDSQNAIGNARALATQDSLGFQGGLNQMLQSGGMNLLQSELSGLGLGDMNIQNLLARAKLRTDLFGRAAGQFGSLLGG